MDNCFSEGKRSIQVYSKNHLTENPRGCSYEKNYPA